MTLVDRAHALLAMARETFTLPIAEVRVPRLQWRAERGSASLDGVPVRFHRRAVEEHVEVRSEPTKETGP